MEQPKYEPSRGGDPSLDDLVSTGKPSLAHTKTVDKLVRGFVASVLDVKTGFMLGREECREPLMVIERLARKAGDVIMGRDPAYDAQPWNNERRLGIRLKVLLPEECKHYGDPGAALFMWLANQALNASKAIEEGMPEEAAQQRLSRTTDDVVARIMGIR